MQPFLVVMLRRAMAMDTHALQKMDKHIVSHPSKHNWLGNRFFHNCARLYGIVKEEPVG